MRKIILVLIVLLSITGLGVGFKGWLGLDPDLSHGLSLVHYWMGLLFLVVFPLYAYDHISHHRRWLRRARLVTFSGGVQATAGALLILTGLVLIAYGVQSWLVARHVHNWLTYVILGSVLLHYTARKDW